MGSAATDPVTKPPLWRRKWARRAAAALLLVSAGPWLGFHVLSWCFPFPEALPGEVRRARESVRVLDRDGRLLRAFLGREETWMFWTDLGGISPRLVEATLAAEDGRFWSHPGVDPLAVARAAWDNATRGRTVSGASTVTMQVMRLLEGRPRTLRSKIVESFRALQLEGRMTKREILAWYLNLAPYGGNLVGAGAASRAWFGKPADDLTIGEAALLAGLPQAPSRLRPDRHPERARARRDWVLGRMVAHGFITEADRDVALREPLPAARRPFPFEAPHAAELVRRRNPGASVLRTTLDPGVQGLAERALRDAVRALRPRGVTNGAVVVIDNRAAAVRALVGSADFFAADDAGQVNGATARRSPGSALKPFTYALAFERGLCGPGTVLPDVPSVFGAYEPENYDGRHLGLVPARLALAASLNIPAVRLLEGVGTASLHALLRDAGLTTLRDDPARYGLALTLGAPEVTLLELTDAYAALARLGVRRPARLLETDPLLPGRRVLSAGAAYLLADVLTDTDRLGGRPVWKTPRAQARMAWKTGTSYGHRDAWTVAYTPSHTVGVWLGNFDGRASRALVGIEAAAPVAARILDRLEEESPAWYATPRGVERVPLCAVSGLPPGPACGDTTRELVFTDRLPREPCPVHREIRVDAGTGARVCAGCAAGRACGRRVVERWPADVAAWLRLHQPGRPLVPGHLPGCARAAAAEPPPTILAPAAGQAYVLEAAADGGAPGRLMLKAAARGERVYWFVDGAFVAEADPLEPVFWPLRRGAHTIVCAGASGRSRSVVISVR